MITYETITKVMNPTLKIPTRTHYATEADARAVARQLGRTLCQIIESTKADFGVEPKEWVFYLEYGSAMEEGMLRNWERQVYAGRGERA